MNKDSNLNALQEGGGLGKSPGTQRQARGQSQELLLSPAGFRVPGQEGGPTQGWGFYGKCNKLK